MLDPIARGTLNMVNRFGGPATLLVDSGAGTYDPATSTTTSSVKEYSVRLLAQDYIQKSTGITTQAGKLIQTGDKLFFILPEDGVPAPRPEVDIIIFEGKRWTAKTFKDYNPSGMKSYLYEVFARQ